MANVTPLQTYYNATFLKLVRLMLGKQALVFLPTGLQVTLSSAAESMTNTVKIVCNLSVQREQQRLARTFRSPEVI